MENIVIKPKKFLLVPTGTYNKQYSRPFRTNVNEFLIRSLFEKTNYGQNLSPTAVAGLASSILSPSTKPTTDIKIKNGWETKRYRFLLVLEVTAGTIQYVQIATGYTDYLGVSTNYLDPNMELYFNSFQTFTRKTTMSQNGLRTILFPYDVTQLIRSEPKTTTGAFKYDHMNPFLECQLLRPQDVFNHLTLNMVSSGLEYPNSGLTTSNETIPYSDMVDTRSISSGMVKTSNRKNGNAASYISSVLTGLKNAKKAYGDTNTMNVYSEASVTPEVADKALSDNKTVRKISAFYSDFSKRGYLKLKELQTVIPEIDFVTKVMSFGQAKKIRAPHETGQTEKLSDATRGAHAAAVLANALPDLMIDSLLGQVSFLATNNYADGLIRFTWTGADGAKSLAEGIEPFIDKFTHRLTNEVLYDMSNQGATRFDIHIFADITDDIQITIGFDGATPEPYAIPAFCDSLFSSVIGDNGKDLSDLATDMESLAVNICDNSA